MKQRTKLIVQCTSDGNSTIYLPYAVAWAAARGIAKDTHHVCILYGKYGTAKFNTDGGGYVEWNERSTAPGIATTFCAKTQVCIS